MFLVQQEVGYVAVVLFTSILMILTAYWYNLHIARIVSIVRYLLVDVRDFLYIWNPL